MTQAHVTDHFVDLDGRRLHVVSCGQGEPVVIFEAGLGCSAADWLRVQRQVGLVTTTYSYDRAGEGRSEAVDSWSVRGWVADLEAWLGELHLTGPYLLVGHSLGGHVVRVFAARRPELVCGMVLVDAQPERLYDGWRPERMQHVRSINPPGIVDRILDGAELVKAVAGPLACPVVVVTHGVVDLIRVEPGVSAEDVADFERCWQEGQRALARQSPQSRLVVATSSGHLLPNVRRTGHQLGGRDMASMTAPRPRRSPDRSARRRAG